MHLQAIAEKHLEAFWVGVAYLSLEVQKHNLNVTGSLCFWDIKRHHRTVNATFVPLIICKATLLSINSTLSGRQ